MTKSLLPSLPRDSSWDPTRHFDPIREGSAKNFTLGHVRYFFVWKKWCTEIRRKKLSDWVLPLVAILWVRVISQDLLCSSWALSVALGGPCCNFLMSFSPHLLPGSIGTVPWGPKRGIIARPRRGFVPGRRKMSSWLGYQPGHFPPRITACFRAYTQNETAKCVSWRTDVVRGRRGEIPVSYHLSYADKPCRYDRLGGREIMPSTKISFRGQRWGPT